MKFGIKKLSSKTRQDFFKVHSASNDSDWCHCVAWWCSTWDEFKQRTAEENRKQREELFDKGIYDGYILYLDEKPIGTAQVGKRDRLKKLCTQYKLESDSEQFSISLLN